MLAGRFSRVNDPVCSTFGNGGSTCSMCQSVQAFGKVKGGLQGSRNHAATGWGMDTSNASGRKEKIITGKGYTEERRGEVRDHNAAPWILYPSKGNVGLKRRIMGRPEGITKPYGCDR